MLGVCGERCGREGGCVRRETAAPSGFREPASTLQVRGGTYRAQAGFFLSHFTLDPRQFEQAKTRGGKPLYMTLMGGGTPMSWLVWVVDMGWLLLGRPIEAGGVGECVNGARKEPGGRPSLQGRPRGRLAGLGKVGPGREEGKSPWGGCIGANVGCGKGLQMGIPREVTARARSRTPKWAPLAAALAGGKGEGAEGNEMSKVCESERAAMDKGTRGREDTGLEARQAGQVTTNTLMSSCKERRPLVEWRPDIGLAASLPAVLSYEPSLPCPCLAWVRGWAGALAFPLASLGNLVEWGASTNRGMRGADPHSWTGGPTEQRGTEIVCSRHDNDGA